MWLFFGTGAMSSIIGSLYMTQIGQLESGFNIVTFWIKFVYAIGKGKDGLVAYHPDDASHRI